MRPVVSPAVTADLESRPEPDVSYDDELQITGPKGSVMIINGSLWHASSANHTDHARVCLLGFFCRAFMKPQQDQQKIVSERLSRVRRRR